LATLNQHKVAELKAMLTRDLPGWSFESAASWLGDARWAETGTTFVENARIKAQFVAKFAPGQFVLADDSGLLVDHLGDKPGVHSSSYGGREGDHGANNARLMREMAGVVNRSARFVCQLLLLTPWGDERLYLGECRGRIIEDLRGTKGFGYDPLFIPEGYEQTFAELGDELKNQLSHRHRAFVQLRNALLSLDGS
jgi:XTP/dITP diphosphohydrolase